MYVTIRNPRTGEVRTLKVGWSWVLFFWSGFLGLPLFLRRLYGWGALFLVIFVLTIILDAAGESDDGAAALAGIVGLVSLGLSIYLGIKGNEITGKNFLDHGWLFDEPMSTSANFARKAWRI
jgi:hypothetical protein